MCAVACKGVYACTRTMWGTEEALSECVKSRQSPERMCIVDRGTVMPRTSMPQTHRYWQILGKAQRQWQSFLWSKSECLGATDQSEQKPATAASSARMTASLQRPSTEAK